MKGVRVGDRVRIREWDDMAEEFGIDDGSILCQYHFPEAMKEACGRTATVRSVDTSGGVELGFDEVEMGKRCWIYSVDMIEKIEDAPDVAVFKLSFEALMEGSVING